MNERTLNVLEFNKVIDLLRDEAETIIGREQIDKIKPETTIHHAIQLQNETDEAVHVHRLNLTAPFSYITDIRSVLRQSEIGRTLTPDECLEIAQVLYCSRNLKQFIIQLEEEFPLLKEQAEKIYQLSNIEKMIHDKVDEHGEVLDSASPTLHGIRRAILAREGQIRDSLQRTIRSKSKMLSDNIVTFRNNRFVLPVKLEYKSAIGGIVHDQSSSGQTLFMEPNAIVQLNNELQQSLVKEKQEIEKILSQMTSKIANYTEEISGNFYAIGELDVIFSRASLAKRMRATKPMLNETGFINLKDARHPLIAEEEVVANDIAIGNDYHALVITGPNTGGKTVTLKLVGLFVLMAQSGLQIPALDNSEIAIFEKVYADIGDEQSIEQNLSTFSSHMTNIVQIVQNLDENSLVLFDEIGAGTDPQEGAALAMAILDNVMKRKATVIATTHYPELKAYSYEQKGMMNASVEFDVETLRPTYRLIIGVPGRSNAFEISKRLGLENSIIQRAKQYVGIDSENVENMIEALEESKRRAENEAQKAYELYKENDELYQSLQNKWQQFEHERNRLYKEAEEKAAQAIENAKKEAEIIVESVRDMKERATWKEHEWIEARKSLEDAQPSLVRDEDIKNTSTSKDIELKIGDEIKHRTLQQHGEIIEQKNNKEFVIQVGTMKLTAKKTDLIFIKRDNHQPSENVEMTSRVVTSDAPVKTELDIRGERYEEALHKLDKYIDDAVVSNYSRVTIVHGKGTGALRKGVNEFLQQNRHVTSFRLGTANEGGTGVTIIELN